MSTLFFMRHAESRANKAKYLASQLDVELTGTGQKDARRIAEEFLSDFRINRIFSSPQLRARQTAAPFADITGVQVNVDSALSEQNLGRFTGMSYEDSRNDPGYENDVSARWNWRPEGGGESYSDIAERIIPFLKRIEKEVFPEENVMIVTHAVAMRIIWAVLKDILPDYPVPIANNGEIWQVNFESTGIAHSINRLYYGNSRLMVYQP